MRAEEVRPDGQVGYGALAEHLDAGFDRLDHAVAELSRLRIRDNEIVDKLHAENTRLRAGEHSLIMKPLVMSLIRLHDQMTSLAGGDERSVAGMLRTQLLQALEMSAGVSAFDPGRGDTFDPNRHFGAGRVGTTDESADNTISRTLKLGFQAADGSIVRPAEVEVARYDRT